MECRDSGTLGTLLRRNRAEMEFPASSAAPSSPGTVVSKGTLSAMSTSPDTVLIEGGGSVSQSSTRRRILPRFLQNSPTQESVGGRGGKRGHSPLRKPRARRQQAPSEDYQASTREGRSPVSKATLMLRDSYAQRRPSRRKIAPPFQKTTNGRLGRAILIPCHVVVGCPSFHS